jgi:SAM-dependent methyltransferase
LSQLALSGLPPKQIQKQSYDAINRELDSGPFAGVSYFLNYGFVANGSPRQSNVTLPAHWLNRNCCMLVFEMVGDCDLAARRVLDVGCGRGGTADLIGRFFTPKSVTGVDLSAGAVSFCRRTHGRPGLRFVEGDAEDLPFGGDSFDVVTNVESSHSYPDIGSFYREVFRVLTRGGHFLYTDLLPADGWRQSRGLLQDLGFTLEGDRDITANVLLACEEATDLRRRSLAAMRDPVFVDEFLAAPGSTVYETMKTGEWVYRIFRLRKP